MYYIDGDTHEYIIIALTAFIMRRIYCVFFKVGPSEDGDAADSNFAYFFIMVKFGGVIAVYFLSTMIIKVIDRVFDIQPTYDVAWSEKHGRKDLFLTMTNGVGGVINKLLPSPKLEKERPHAPGKPNTCTKARYSHTLHQTYYDKYDCSDEEYCATMNNTSSQIKIPCIINGVATFNIKNQEISNEEYCAQILSAWTLAYACKINGVIIAKRNPENQDR